MLEKAKVALFAVIVNYCIHVAQKGRDEVGGLKEKGNILEVDF